MKRVSATTEPEGGPPSLVLGYGVVDESKIDEGIRRLAAVLGEAGRF